MRRFGQGFKWVNKLNKREIYDRTLLLLLFIIYNWKHKYIFFQKMIFSWV